MRTPVRLRMLAALLLTALPLLGVTPAVAAGAHRGVDDFTFSSFDARYELGIDDEGHSTLTTTETFVAEFPETDQNRGIQRALPDRYRGHPTDLELVSVTDADGAPREYETENDDENLIVTIAGDDYVHGEQTYVLTYTQRDVTAYFENTDDDEFYWDTNGVQWRQPFTSHRTTIVVAPELVPSLTGDTGCYVGAAGSTTPCDIVESSSDGATVFTTAVGDLAPGENVTVGIAFEPHTFTERDTSYLSGSSSWVQLIATLLLLLTAVGALVYRLTRLRDGRGRPVIVPEYTPPRGEDLLIASVVTQRSKRAAAASFVDYAVRRKLQIVERSEPGMFGASSEYWLRLVTAEGLNPHERGLAGALFGPALQPDSWHELKKKDTALAKAIHALMQATRKRARAEGYLGRSATGFGSLLLVTAMVLGGVVFVAGVVSGEAGLGGAVPILLIFLAFALVVATAFIAFRTPLTAKGAELRDYIAGIRMYLTWAEEDRFRLLQSPEGALRTGVDAPDWGQVVKLYEKLLPYAVLLGVESEWAKVLGTYYENLGGQPEWYGGPGPFDAHLFASSMSSLSASTASSYSGSSSSSSSGFSGGGGSSGGGGGGGGGGGV